MSRWDIFRWRTLAGGRWCPVGTVQRRPRRQPRPLMASSMPRRFPPSFPVTPPQACAALWHKRRRGDTDVCGALTGCPRRGRRGLREATFLVRYRPGKTLRCFPSFLLCAARL